MGNKTIDEDRPAVIRLTDDTIVVLYNERFVEQKVNDEVPKF